VFDSSFISASKSLIRFKGLYICRIHIFVLSAIAGRTMWVLWRERNLRVFEGQERTVLDLKLVLLRTLFDWLHCSSSYSPSYFEEFLDSCTLL
jgi:hypothetical protein